MELPPEGPNEPEWLIAQRAGKAANRQFVLALGPMQAAFAISWLPVLLIDVSSIAPIEMGVILVAYSVVIVAICLRLLRRRTTARTVGRYVVNYIAISWGIFGALAFLATTVWVLSH